MRCKPGRDECPYRDGCCGRAKIMWPAGVKVEEPWKTLEGGDSYCAPGDFARYFEEIDGEATVYEYMEWLFNYGSEGMRASLNPGGKYGNWEDLYNDMVKMAPEGEMQM